MSSFPKPLQIGNFSITPPLVLAPMAGLTHSPVRRLIASFGSPGLFFSEMLSARSLAREDLADSLYLQRTEAERPMAFQIFAADPQTALAGGRRLLETDAEIIDFNLACPAPEIRKQRAGAFLLADLRQVEAILAALTREIDRPLTVKIRLGKEPDRGYLRELASLLEACGVAAVTLHPRITTEKLKRRSRWEYIGYLKSVTRLPVIGNGDVTTREECFAMLRQTGCDAVMIGRAAIQKPWLFAEICGREIPLSPPFLYETYRLACGLIAGFFPERKALGRIKEFTWFYARNLRFGHFFAARLQSRDSVAACLALAEEHFLKAC